MNKIITPQVKTAQLKTAQLDIFGKPSEASETKGGSAGNTVANKKKFYPVVTLATGLNDVEIQNDFMLVHRILQRKLRSNLSRNIEKLVQIVYNEMLIKSGSMEITTATRTSLLMCLT